MSTLKVIGYTFAVSVATSLAALLVGACMFGFQLAHWAEWQGRLLGVVGTITGVAGAVIGLWIAFRKEWRAGQ